MALKIIGSGMAGLLAANSLRRMLPEIDEAQPALPNNHKALLRFRSDVCSKATGIPFKRVSVHKAVSYNGQLFERATLQLNNMYSFKVTGKVVNRSIINLEPGERYIAPDDFILQMAASVKINYGKGVGQELSLRDEDSEPLISTIPMPVLMDLLNWPNKPKFESRTVWSVRAKLDGCDVFQTVYYPAPEQPYYRASITGNLLIVEYLKEPVSPLADTESVLSDLGIPVNSPDVQVKEQKYGKLVPLEDPMVARRFIVYATDHFRIYSLGRFATWRQLLLDSVCADIDVIEKIIESRDGYDQNMTRAGL